MTKNAGLRALTGAGAKGLLLSIPAELNAGWRRCRNFWCSALTRGDWRQVVGNEVGAVHGKFANLKVARTTGAYPAATSAALAKALS